VRQGDPFSPFLFNLAVEGLVKMIKQAQLSNLVTGGCHILLLEELCSSDDTILLIQDDMEQIIHLKWILYMFEVMHGLKIKFLKSEVMIFLPYDDKKIIYDDIFGCQVRGWQIKYLGVLVC
jgi:mannosylglycoprotein endo-beta-mannosidase